MLRNALITVSLVVSATSLALGQQSSRADFEELLQAMEGRWIGDVTWNTDWPGLGKKGDKTTGYVELRVIADGNVLLGTFYGGRGTDSWMTVYDAASKQIKTLEGDSGGSISSYVWYKEGDHWIATGAGSLADGSKVEFRNTVTISDGGNTHTYTGTTTIAGKRGNDLHDVWRRVYK